MLESAEIKEYNCQIELTLDIIGGKWKPLILYHVNQFGVVRYGELKRAIPNINERMLTRQLRELEKDQLINREVYKEVPPKVEYSLTDVGESLTPILQQLGDWGRTYNQRFNICTFDILHKEDQ